LDLKFKHRPNAEQLTAVAAGQRKATTDARPLSGHPKDRARVPGCRAGGLIGGNSINLRGCSENVQPITMSKGLHNGRVIRAEDGAMPVMRGLASKIPAADEALIAWTGIVPATGIDTTGRRRRARSPPPQEARLAKVTTKPVP
jgi:hypothetical protein